MSRVGLQKKHLRARTHTSKTNDNPPGAATKIWNDVGGDSQAAASNHSHQEVPKSSQTDPYFCEAPYEL